MAAVALGAISVPSRTAASASVLSFPDAMSSSQLILRRNFRNNALRVSGRATAAAYQVTLITPEGDQVVHVSKDECILDAAEREGVVLPHNCRSGACSSCVGLLKSGSLNQDEQAFLDEAQLQAGFALMCASYPTSDCVIETHQEERFY